MSLFVHRIPLTFKQLESSMCKRRRLDLPKLPSTPQEFAELLLESPFSHNFRFSIRDANGTAVVFATDFLLSKLIEAETIHFDATFKVVTHIFDQLFTIFIQYKGHAVPAVHILMTNKSEDCIQQYCPNFRHILRILSHCLHFVILKKHRAIPLLQFSPI